MFVNWSLLVKKDESHFVATVNIWVVSFKLPVIITMSIGPAYLLGIWKSTFQRIMNWLLLFVETLTLSN